MLIEDKHLLFSVLAAEALLSSALRWQRAAFFYFFVNLSCIIICAAIWLQHKHSCIYVVHFHHFFVAEFEELRTCSSRVV